VLRCVRPLPPVVCCVPRRCPAAALVPWVAAALVPRAVAAWWVPAVSPVLVALAWQVVAVLALLAVVGNWYLPGSILTMLINAIGMVLLIVWTFIIISLMRLHPSLERSGSLVIRMPGWPWLPWLVLAGLGGIGVLMLMSDEGRAQLVSMGALTLLIVAIYFVRQLVLSRKQA